MGEPRQRRGSFPLHMSTKSSLSDAQVLKDSQSYPWMFGILIDRHQKVFLRKGFDILRSRDFAEDAVQDTFIKIYKYAHKFSERKNASFRSWAYKILVNTCYSLATQKAKDSSRLKAMDLTDLDVVESTDTLAGKERASFVQSILSRLPRHLSRLLSLYFFEDKSYKEIAVLEDITVSAVRSGLHRARKQFKNVAVEMI